MKKRITNLLLLGAVWVASAYADMGETVYQKVCSTCHEGYIDEVELNKNFFEMNNTLLHLKAPTFSQISEMMHSKIGDPNADEDMQRLEASAFIADYIIYPDKSKSILNPRIGKFFGTMPSLKGKLSTEEIEAISTFVYDYNKNHPHKKHVNFVSFEKALKKAKAEGKIILIKAEAPRCRYCKKMNRVCKTDEITRILNKGFVVVSIDVSKESLPMDLRVSMTPTFFFVFVNPKNDKLKIKRIPGAWSREDFKDILTEAMRIQHAKE